LTLNAIAFLQSLYDVIMPV